MKKIAWILVIVGGVNWGLVAVGNWIGSNLDVVNLIFGGGLVGNLIYLLVGISAISMMFGCNCSAKCCKDTTCEHPKSSGSMNM